MNNNCHTVDYHSHLLPSIDDGPADIEDSVKMARILATSGFKAVHCTPHYLKGVYNQSTSDVIDSIKQLQAEIDKSGIQLQLLAGREYNIDEFLLSALTDPLTIGNSKMVLVEAPVHVQPDLLKDILHQVVMKGFTPLLAHPERCLSLNIATPNRRSSGLIQWFYSIINYASTKDNVAQAAKQNDQELCLSSTLTYLREIGCLFQGNIGSFAGIYGDQIRARAILFLKAGLYSHLGTDAHSSKNLNEIIKTGIAEITRQAGEENCKNLLSGRALQFNKASF